MCEPTTEAPPTPPETVEDRRKQAKAARAADRRRRFIGVRADYYRSRGRSPEDIARLIGVPLEEVSQALS